MSTTSNHLAILFALALLTLAPPFASPRAHAQDAQPTPSTQPTPPTADAPNTPNAANTSGARRAARDATGSITGRVLGEGGEPLAGVRVLALSPTTNRSNVETPTQTDDSGAFKLDNLPPGLYTVGAILRGYVPDPEAYPSSRPPTLYRVGDDVTVRLVRGGVVTGTVTGADGEPLVAINVRAVHVRDLEGDTAAAGITFEDQTDDRGVYRIYGLRQGVYVLSTGTGNARNWPGAPYRNDSPTYYPSGTRDTATEITVRAAQEVGGIDIRHRGDRGRRVTGVVVNPPSQQGAGGGVSVVLTHAATGTQVGTALTQPSASGERAFAFEGVGEGEYEVQARSSEGGFWTNTSTPQRVVVAPAGGDVTGLRVTLTPLASVSGSLIIEPLAEADRDQGSCKERRDAAPMLPQEASVAAHKEGGTPKQPIATQRATARRETAPDSSGNFTLRALEPGRYRLDLRLGDEGWYVRDLQLPATQTTTNNATTTTKPAAARKTNTPSANTTNANTNTTTTTTRETVELKSGQQLEGILVRVAEGAATLSGRLAPRDENAPIPASSQLRVHLVPAARELSDNPLRFHEATPAPDGSFNFKHVAPGRYLLLVRGAETEATRASLRRAAEASGTSIELQPCQRVNDFALRFPQSQGN